MRRISIAFCLLTCLSVQASINLDGQLDEPEWQSAQVFNALQVVEPFVLTEPAYDTEIRVFSDESGIYFGIKNKQPMDSRNNDVTARDRGISSDKNNIIIDFDNNGITAYGFEIGSGGSIRDGIWSDESRFSSEWDGNWQAQTSSTPTEWIVEVRIPWDVVSMKQGTSEKRTVAWYLARDVVHSNQRYATAPINSDRQRFVSQFMPLSITDYAASSLQMFAYATARNDFISDDVSHDVGADLFWKSGRGKQLSLTLNPDFGQIESDNLVVNFEPTEVFFNERRPFFTENQSLFDVRGAESLRLLNTRRIGARPDAGSRSATPIDAAVKYTDNREQLTYGFFAAAESSDSGAEGFSGRDFFAGRLIHRSENQSTGFLATFTKRPDLDREASVYAVDHEYLVNQQWRINSLWALSDISEAQSNEADWSGRIQVNQQMNENSNQRFELSHYGRDFDVRDFGYLPRNNLNTLRYNNSFRYNNYQASDLLQEREFRIDANIKRNDEGVTLGSYFRYLQFWRYKNTSSLSAYVEYLTSGKDDLFSRGNGILNTQSGYTASMTYRGKNTGKFRNHGYIDYTDTYLGGQGIGAHIHPSYYFTDNYFASWGFYYTDTNNWLNWQDSNLIGSYNRKQLRSILDFSANISQRQELRLRFQWIAIDAEANRQLRLNTQGNLQATPEAIEDFSISNTALQMRYRYELSPLSNIFVVYSRGSDFFQDESESIPQLLDNGWNDPDSDNFLIKIRYKFY